MGGDSAIDLHPQRPLFLGWPPATRRHPVSALGRYRGEFFIYAGEVPLDDTGLVCAMANGGWFRKGTTITGRFFDQLRCSWQLIEMVELPHWEICLDNLYIFKRKRTSAGDL